MKDVTVEKAESLVDQIQEVQEGAREEELQKEVTKGRCDFAALPLSPNWTLFPWALEED